MSTAMKSTKRTWTRFGIGAGFVLLAFFALSVWNKHDFCQGWANHYAVRAKQLRAEAANGALGPDEARERLIAADLDDVVSRKYAAVAWRPWRRYPGYPMVTLEEQRIAAGKN